MKPIDDANAFLERLLIGKTIRIPRLRKPRVVKSVELTSEMVGEYESEVRLGIGYGDGYYQFSDYDEIEIVGE